MVIAINSYTPITVTVFEFFDCLIIDSDLDISVVRTHPSILCNSTLYETHVAGFVVILIFFVILAPLVLLVLSLYYTNSLPCYKRNLQKEFGHIVVTHRSAVGGDAEKRQEETEEEVIDDADFYEFRNGELRLKLGVLTIDKNTGNVINPEDDLYIKQLSSSPSSMLRAGEINEVQLSDMELTSIPNDSTPWTVLLDCYANGRWYTVCVFCPRFSDELCFKASRVL